MQDEVKKMPRNTAKVWSMAQQDGVPQRISNHISTLISVSTFCLPIPNVS